MPANDWEAGQRQVALDDYSQEDDNNNSVAHQLRPLRQIVRRDKDESRQDDCHHDIDQDVLHRIGDGVLALSDKITQHHRRTITGHAAPGTCPVAELRNEEDVDGEEHQAAGQ